MLRSVIALTLFAATAVAADNPETLTERSQASARAVLDRAVEANGGAAALRAVKVVRLQLEGETYPRLQMTTPEPPFEGGVLKESLLVDLENNRLRLDQRTGGFGFAGDTTVTIASGQGTTYDHRARTATPIPAAQATQQQFIQYYRRLPNLLLRQALDRANTLRYLGEESFEGRRHDVVTFVMPDAVQVVHVRGRRERAGLEVRADLRGPVDRRRGVRDPLWRLPQGRELPGPGHVHEQPGRRGGREVLAARRDQPGGHGRLVQRRRRRLPAGAGGARQPARGGREARRRRVPDPERRRPEPEHARRRILGPRGRGRGAGLERGRRRRDRAHQGTVPGQADPPRRDDTPSRRPHRRPAQLHRRGRDRRDDARQPRRRRSAWRRRRRTTVSRRTRASPVS